MTDDSQTLNEFCESERLSRSMLYKMWNQGIGPDYFFIGSTKRISQEARAKWRHEREAAAKVKAEAAQAA
jgi:hypothetical protein